MTEIPKSVLNQYLDCTDCTGTTLVSDAFDMAFKSWPQQMWIGYRCPACDAVNHLSLASNTVVQGYIDGAPGLCHHPTRTIQIPKLSVTATTDAIRIKTLNLTWSISASETG